MQRPQEVFDKACEAIAADEVLAGFAYRKSQHQLTRSRGPWTELLSLTTSSRNTPEYVTLDVWVDVDDTRLEEWRERVLPARRNLRGRLFRKDLGTLTNRLPWNFAEPEFETSCARIVSPLAEAILPFFEDV